MKQNRFKPPYCPNHRCQAHKKGQHFYYKNGWIKTAKFPHRNRRYKCKLCNQQFSYNTFTLDFRRKRYGLYEEIHYNYSNSMSNCSIARKLKISETTVRSYMADLSRQAVLVEKERHRGMAIGESLAYDGFESFCNSQYSPCYINTVVGCKSLYTYKTTYSPLNRKGRMTELQKRKNIELIGKFGKYPPGSIRQQTTYILKDLIERAAVLPLILKTDEHKSYEWSIKNDLPADSIWHQQTNSKVTRDSYNPLFPVNHLHMRYRHFTAAHKRETIAFQRNEAALMDRINIKRLYKNYMCPKFFRRKKDPYSNTHSPAMLIGLTRKILTFDELYNLRRMRTQYDLDQQELAQYERTWDFSRETIRKYDGN